MKETFDKILLKSQLGFNILNDFKNIKVEFSWNSPILYINNKRIGELNMYNYKKINVKISKRKPTNRKKRNRYYSLHTILKNHINIKDFKRKIQKKIIISI